MNKITQKSKILYYLQKHPKVIVEAKDFMSFISTKPFVGYSSSCRLSELKKAWYIKCVWFRKWCFNIILKKNKDINLYQITSKGLNYNFD